MERRAVRREEEVGGEEVSVMAGEPGEEQLKEKFEHKKQEH